MKYTGCGGFTTCLKSRRTVHAVSAGQLRSKQEWRIEDPIPGGEGSDEGRGRKSSARGRGDSLSSPRVPNRFTVDDQLNGKGHSSRSSGKIAPRPYNPARSHISAPTPEQRTPRPVQQAGESQDPFANLHSWIQMQHADGVVVRRETWEKLLGHIHTSAQATQAMELMLQDAKVRETAEWDWATHGYGQTAFQLVQVAAAVGAPELAVKLLVQRETLHITLNKDLVPSLIRKVAAATATLQSADVRDRRSGGGGEDVDLATCVEIVNQLYEKEASLCGANSPEAAYELSRVLRRAGDVRGVRSLHTKIQSEKIEVRERLLDDMERWLAKRGIQM